MSETTPALEVLPKPPSRLPPWFGMPVVIVMLIVVSLLTSLVVGHLFLVIPYQHVVVTPAMPLGTVIDNCQPQVQIEHPGILSLDNQNVQPPKRIVIALSCAIAPLTRTVPLTHTVPITFEIKPDSESSGWIRFLNAQGEDISATFVTKIPPGGQSRMAVYPECVAQSTPPPSQLHFSVVSTSADGEGAEFSIRLESRIRTFLRHAVGSVSGPLSAGQLALLSSLGALIWRWWQTWNEKQQKFSNLYEEIRKNKGNLAALRESYSRYQGLQGVFPLSIIFQDPRIEDLHRAVEAEECLHRATKSLEKNDFGTARVWDCRLFAWDRMHWAIPVLGCLVNLLADDSTPDPQKCLEQLRRGWDRTEPGLRRQMVRALSLIPLAEAHKFLKEKQDDPDLGVRIEIAWAFSRVERPPDLDRRLRRLVTASPDEWLATLPDPLVVRDPFRAAIAESADPATEPFIWEHPLYGQLCVPVAMTVLAPDGGGKTTARLALKRRFWGTFSDVFVLEYTDFHRLALHPDHITSRRHVAEILRCAARAVSSLLVDDPKRLGTVQDPNVRRLIHSLLTNHLFDHHLTQQLRAALQGDMPSPDEELPGLLSGRLPAEAMRDLVTVVRALGFAELYLLMDRLNNLPEAQDTAVAKALLRHLLNDSAFLDVPHLHVKLFLPIKWEEIVVGCSGLCSGRMHLRRLQWDEKSLLAMLKEHLQVTGVESLNRLAADNIYPRDLDRALAREAKDSPRRLVELGETLLRLRALEWEKSDRDPSKARLQTEDWAAMLEHGLRRAAERETSAG